RREFTRDIESARKLLILGDGDGRFTADFLRQNLTAFVDSLESSQAMSRLAEARIATVPGGRARVRQIREDPRTAQLTGNYDVVIAHFFLDCFTTEELKVLIRRIAGH